ncbi:hypothetical protein ABZ567_31315 [Streptomyces sp. NPDC016459]|uniref:hypothetical protein n=1 Tax=Streptomyces sp. NPDC016459 TaxID=3157190 RepID=UPI0033CB6C68
MNTEPTGDHFTEAAIRRNTYLDAAREATEAAKLFPGNLECAPAIGALEGLSQRLQRLAAHHTTAEQPLGLTWEARADHAVRLYARTAIELEDSKAEAARLRAERAELIAQRDRIADDTIKALIAEEQHPAAATTAQAYRAAADEINALPQDYETDPGRGNAAEFLRRRATELETAEQPPADEYQYCGAAVDQGEKGYDCARPHGHKGRHAPHAADIAPR